jgi:cytochrome c2
MNTLVSAILGIAFVVLATGLVFLMYHLWGYPFDKATRTSAAPRGLMLLHRGLGYAFVVLYVFMMTQMVPRLFRYQVELPPRTVVHICLAITIGLLLLVKITILRWFRHLEEWMPFLGTGILICTYLMVGLSTPFALREYLLRKGATGGDVVSKANLERLEKVLPNAGFPKEAPLAELSKPENIRKGRDVLLRKCVTCHDLRTVLLRPRPPQDWVKTVTRMADKPILDDDITEEQQWAVATYLIAITPELKSSAAKARDRSTKSRETKAAAIAAIQGESDRAFDAAKVKPLFEQKCNECHTLEDVDKHDWKGEDDAKEVLQLMVDNGLEATPEEIESLRQYLVVTYVKGKGATKPAPAGTQSIATAASTTAPTTGAAASTTKPKTTPPPTATTTGASATTAATATAAAATATATAAQGEATCGTKPLPDCPMQAWMKANAAPASATGDTNAIAAVFDRIARMAPPGYGNWAAISNQGAAAARGEDLKGARAACTQCHNEHRARYKSEMRARPVN